jgi:hypothetical protein
MTLVVRDRLPISATVSPVTSCHSMMPHPARCLLFNDSWNRWHLSHGLCVRCVGWLFYVHNILHHSRAAVAHSQERPGTIEDYIEYVSEILFECNESTEWRYEVSEWALWQCDRVKQDNSHGHGHDHGRGMDIINSPCRTVTVWRILEKRHVTLVVRGLRLLSVFITITENNLLCVACIS